jgi:hypothetical protein
LTQTWNLQKKILLGEVWVFNYSGCYHKALLWWSSKWEFEVTFQTTCTYGQDNGSSSKGSYFCLHEGNHSPTCVNVQIFLVSKGRNHLQGVGCNMT